MKKWIATGLLFLSSLQALADFNNGGSTVNANTYDYLGNGITSTVQGSKRLLDVSLSGSAVSSSVAQGSGNGGSSPWSVMDSPAETSLASILGQLGANTNTLSTSANQTNGAQKTQVVDGSGNVQPAGDINSRGIFVKPGDGTNTQGYTASNEAKVLVTPLTNASVVKAQLQDNSGAAITLGQKVSASSIPVVLSSDQAAVSENIAQFGGSNVVTGVGNSGAGIPRVTVSSDSSITNITGTISLPTGAATSTNQSLQLTQETSTATNTNNLATNQTNGAQKTQRVDGSGNIAPSMDIPARAGFQEITNGTNTAAVKAASTAAVATDPALVVAISPNNTPVLPSGAATAANQTSVIGSASGGAAATSSLLSGGQYNTSLPTLTNGQQAAIQLDSSGRAIVSPLSSSSTVTVVQPTAANLNAQVVGNVASGSADSGNGVKVSGVYNSTPPVFTSGNRADIQSDINGNEDVSINNVPWQMNNNILASDRSVYGPGVSMTEISQFSGQFDRTIAANPVSTSSTGNGSVTQANSNVILAAGSTTANGYATMQSLATLSYTPGREVFNKFTAHFIAPTNSADFARVGIYNTTSGYYLGYNGTTPQVCVRFNSVDTCTLQGSWDDNLTGASTSKFTLKGVPQTLNFALKNVYRIRYGWLGAAPIYFEVMAPDGNWVTFYTVRYPNTSTNPSVLTPVLPFTMEASKTSGTTTNVSVANSSFDVGMVISPKDDITGTGSIAAVNGATYIPTQGTSLTTIVISGTWVGTLQIYGNINGLTNNAINGNTLAGIPASGTITTNQTIQIASAGYSSVSIVATAWTSGTAQINYEAAEGSPSYTTAQGIGTSGTPLGGVLSTQSVYNVGRLTPFISRNVNSSVNITTSAFVTLQSNIATQVNAFDFYDTSGQELILCYSATSTITVATGKCKYLAPYGSGSTDWQVPTGSYIGVEAVSANATTGVDVWNFMN
jgi:hypothetical protein